MYGSLAGVGALWAYAFGQFPAGGTGSAELITGTLAVALLAVAITLRLAHLGLLPPSRVVCRRVSVPRGSDRRVRTPRVLDPDAAGRPRPRAPSAYPSAV